MGLAMYFLPKRRSIIEINGAACQCGKLSSARHFEATRRAAAAPLLTDSSGTRQQNGRRGVCRIEKEHLDNFRRDILVSFYATEQP